MNKKKIVNVMLGVLALRPAEDAGGPDWAQPGTVLITGGTGTLTAQYTGGNTAGSAARSGDGGDAAHRLDPQRRRGGEAEQRRAEEPRVRAAGVAHGRRRGIRRRRVGRR